MALVDYSLERFPEHIVDHVELIDDVEQLEFGVLDVDAEEQADRTNTMIASWIERLAASSSGACPAFMPGQSYVGLRELEVIGDGKMEKFEVGFFRDEAPF